MPRGKATNSAATPITWERKSSAQLWIASSIPRQPTTANRQPPTSVMCAEAVPWRCHRNLLSDDLVRRGIEVIHILEPGSAQPHTLNEMATIAADRVIYPPHQGRMF
jgi:hypothetical protein